MAERRYARAPALRGACRDGIPGQGESAAEQAASKAKDAAGDVQAKRELGQTYGELGRATFELIESGEVSHATLDPLAEKIRELQAKVADGAVSEAEEPAGTTA
jgi:hypothetical protein